MRRHAGNWKIYISLENRREKQPDEVFLLFYVVICFTKIAKFKSNNCHIKNYYFSIQFSFFQRTTDTIGGKNLLQVLFRLAGG
jgi:hypothetical protein